jgi:phosphonate transport system substrate-binding protein
MKKSARWIGCAAALAVVAVAAAACGGSSSSSSSASSAVSSAASSAANAASTAASTSTNVCPNGQVTFGVEPYDEGAQFTAAYQALTSAISANLHCPVKLYVTQNYTSEVEAMRANKLDVG